MIRPVKKEKSILRKKSSSKSKKASDPNSLGALLQEKEAIMEDDEGYTVSMNDLEKEMSKRSADIKKGGANELIGIGSETRLDSGIASFMKLANEKKVLDVDLSNRPLSMGITETMKKKIVAQDGSYHSIDDRYRYDHDIDRLGHRRLKHFDGSGVTGKMAIAFEDKEDYTPNFELTYFDGKGMNVEKKEAFRILSHRFHGKGSGKNKELKRQKKQEEKVSAKKATYNHNSIMMNMLNKKQKKDKEHFVILSGQTDKIKGMATSSSKN